MVKRNFRKTIVACGAESKGSFCIAKGRNVFISKEFGNLSDYGNLSRYEKAIKRDLKRLGIRPDIAACDMHPDYNSTELAQALKRDGAKLVEVQHHHAHIASCMYDNGLSGEVIGAAFDGTGYGPDGAIWGGEFIISSFKRFKRAGHLKYLPMAGGDKAVTEPWRMAAAYLTDSFGDKFLNLNIPFTKRIKAKEWRLLRYAIDRGINSPPTNLAPK